MAHERDSHLDPETIRLARIVRGDLSRLREWANPADLLEAAERHGVLPLVAEHFAAENDRPSAFDAIAARARQHAAADLAQHAALVRCARALGTARVPALFIKGAHLAYTHYARPDLRPRVDADVLVPAASRHDAEQVLRAHGYVTRISGAGETALGQSTHVLDRDGVSHIVDLHWRLVNPRVFDDVLTFDELSRDAVSLERLDPSAKGLSDVHAFVVACLHRIAHHHETPRLIWLSDIALVGGRLDDAGWQAVRAIARARGLAEFCARGWDAAREAFAPAGPVDPFGEGDSQSVGSTAAYLRPSRSRATLFWADAAALQSWRQRWQLARELVFPSSRYMRQVYAPASSAPLPVLYTRRVLHGARRWLKRL